MTIGGEDANRNRCVMEIRAGTGGEEAALFRPRSVRHVQALLRRSRLEVELLDMNPTELGGFKEIVLGIDGDAAFPALAIRKRRPSRAARARNRSQRAHPHFGATVAVLAEPEDVEIDIKPEDYRLDLFCASGPGGQHVNKTQSAVRLTHLESGLVVQCQDEKSQHKNKAKALRVLKTRLYEHKREQEHAKRAEHRRTLVGSGDRSQTHPHLQLSRKPADRSSHQSYALQVRHYHVRQPGSGHRSPLDHDRQEQRQLMGTVE